MPKFAVYYVPPKESEFYRLGSILKIRKISGVLFEEAGFFPRVFVKSTAANFRTKILFPSIDDSILKIRKISGVLFEEGGH